MKRTTALSELESRESPWDFVIIGGGATGLGTAIEAASRGYDPLLLEMHDFAKATSSRSTKLIHGGVRYLEQGDIPLLLGALQERGRLQQNAPHLVHNLPFVVPTYKWWERSYYGLGLKLYDLMAGRQSFGRSRFLSLTKTLERLPTIESEGLRGGVLYHDGQFDDARLAINMAQTAVEQGAVLLNYVEVTGLTKTHGAIDGVVAVDRERGTEYEIEARAVINATGIFTDTIREMDDPNARPTLRPSQGVHIVLDDSFLPGSNALMVPRTEDGRVLFAIPWHGRVVIGTTDTPIDDVTHEPTPQPQELSFLLEHARRYLIGNPRQEDILSVFTGIRPLVAPPTHNDDTADIPREHQISVSDSGLVTISGGKWTTYRKMAEKTIDRAAASTGLEERASVTRTLPIHGWHKHPEQFGDLAQYGSDAIPLRRLMRERPSLAEPFDDRLPLRPVQVVWGARHEMARTVEDVLARRSRCLLLDAQASIDIAPQVAQLLAQERGLGEEWQREQVEAFTEIAERYLPSSIF